MTASTHVPLSPEAVDLSLKKTHFFTKADFTKLFKAPRKQSRFFIWHCLKDPSFEYPSFGVVVSKKNAKTNVRRNLVKRLVREHFRLNQHDLTHVKIMLVAKREVGQAQRQDLNQDLTQLFNTLKQLQKS